MADLGRGVAVIRRRSEVLLHFTQTYRQLSKHSAATFRPVAVWALFEHVVALLEPAFAQRGLDPDILLPDTNLHIVADATLVEQVLSNLVTNALEALQHQPAPQPRLAAYAQAPHRVVLEVADNSPGLDAPLLDEIFVLFFTTKMASSGLSLSRQIMQLYRGSIQVQPEVGRVASFSCYFRRNNRLVAWYFVVRARAQ